MNFNLPAANSQVDTFSGNIDLSGIAGNKVYFASQYKSSGTGGNTSTLWRVDNFNLRDAEVGFSIVETGGNTTLTPVRDKQSSVSIALYSRFLVGKTTHGRYDHTLIQNSG